MTIPAARSNSRTAHDINTDDLDLSNLNLGSQRPDDSEIRRLATAEGIRQQLYDLGDRDDDEQDDSIILGDLDDIEGSPRGYSRTSNKNNNRRESRSSGSSSEDFAGNFDMKLNGVRREVNDRIYKRRTSSDEELNGDDDDLSIGTLSRTSASPTMSPRRPPIIVNHMRLPTTSAASTDIPRNSPTSAFDGLSQGLKKELERNSPPLPTTTTTAKIYEKSMLGGGTKEEAKRVFGQPIGNVMNPEGTRRPVAVFSKDVSTKSPNVGSASRRSALPKQRPISTIYSTNRPSAGPTPSAPNPSLASAKSTATSIPSPRQRPAPNDENVRPSTFHTSSTPAPAPRGGNTSRHSILLVSPTPPSPSYDYSQRIRDNNARQAGIQEEEEEDESFADDDAEVDRLRLPDVTGLTEGMMSPEKPRGHRPIKESISTVKGSFCVPHLFSKRRS